MQSGNSVVGGCSSELEMRNASTDHVTEDNPCVKASYPETVSVNEQSNQCKGQLTSYQESMPSETQSLEKEHLLREKL